MGIVCNEKRHIRVDREYDSIARIKVYFFNTNKGMGYMKIAYIRVSTIQQNAERQVELMKAQGVERMFLDTASGKDFERPQFQEMLKMLREGDIVYFESASRLSRNLKQTLQMVEDIKNMKVSLVFLKENLTLDPHDKGLSKTVSEMFLALLSSFAEIEREHILDRQQMGLEKAKALHLLGPKPTLTKEKFDFILQKIEQGTPINRIAKDMNHSRHTLYYWIRMHKNGGIQRSDGVLYLNGKKLS